MPVKAAQENRLENLMALAGARDRVNIEKHLAACDAEPNSEHGLLWRRLMAKLSELAPLPIRTAGSQIMQFYVADGKYRMQVFALEDRCDGTLVLYLPNVLTKAVSEKLLVKNSGQYSLAGAAKQVLSIDQMDVNNPSDPPEFVKHMMGWNRKALKLTLLASDSDSAQVNAAESLCELAAKQWAISTR
jgi:hypothetical protein